MKHFPRSFFTRVFIVFSALVHDSFAQNDAKSLTIIHTNDLQSRLLGIGPNREYTPLTLHDEQTVGGIARVATVIKTLRQKAPETTLVIDGGDVLMGTLFHTVAREESAELRLLQAIGNEAITLGNHEFDFRPPGLAQIIKAAVARGDIPTLLCANAVFNEVDTRDDSLQALFERGVVKPYQIFVKNGLRIGVFGLLGSRAAEVAPFAEPVTFADPVAAARSIVKRLKDVVGGHSHTWLKTPIVVNNTPVLQAGAEGRYVGVLSLSVKNGSTTMTDYRIIAINDSVEADREIQTMVEKYEDVINQNILRPYGFRCDQTLAETNFSLVDEAPGFALMSFYLTAAEIKKALEVVTTVYPLKGLDFFLQISEAKFRYNANRAPFDRVVDIELADQRGQFTPLDLSADDRQLYKVGCNIVVGTFSKFVGDFTWGLLTIVPKDSLGNPIADLNTALVDADPYEPGIQEVKQWAAFCIATGKLAPGSKSSTPSP